jgi:hypothetical protein
MCRFNDREKATAMKANTTTPKMGHKVKMLIEVDLAPLFDGPEAIQWLGEEVLMNQTDDGALYLQSSNKIVGNLGRVRVLVVHDWPPHVTTHDSQDYANGAVRKRRGK